MDNLLKGLKHVTAYIDDIVVTGADEEEHLEPGLRRRSVYSLVEYLGHLIDEEGLQPTRSKVEAIMDAPTPRVVSELRSFL